MINRITLINGVKIINDKYVIKKNTSDIKKIYSYLLSRSFDYMPKLIDVNDDTYTVEYIKDIYETKEQKMIDLVILLSILHNKTTFYKEIDLEHYKYIYEEIEKEINDDYEYYNKLMDVIDNEVYMSPANYLIARNISIIYKSLGYAQEYINKWYKLIDGKREARVVMLHNNINIDHYLKEDKPYFISFDNSKIDLPVFDLIKLYKYHYLDFDFINLFDIYFSKYPFTEEEMYLFLAILAIPDKIKNSNSEYERVKNVRLIIDYLYKTDDILKKYRIKEKTNKSDEFNKKN
jgi:hypothetical protein